MATDLQDGNPVPKDTETDQDEVCLQRKYINDSDTSTI
jgi:hypothetical protein